ncbi:Sodium channel subunit beta-1 [Merluccius polli]|uniref:Sodium channel regulatory subunit beta-3 n=1 Tax=Merluccius polli TaxID=89951 RepID=A0AA47NNN8_MERPO|nr:Sodium channel subunit beta-1 [Merluccius polli]
MFLGGIGQGFTSSSRFLRGLLEDLELERPLSGCWGGCAEVDSLTEAVDGEGFLLGCISCKKREEVNAMAVVDWFFRPQGHDNYSHIFQYDHPTALSPHPGFAGRVSWRGTLDQDVQIGAIFISNLTANDSGTYRCRFHRTLFFSLYNQESTVEKVVELQVVAEAQREVTAVVAEIMMYVLIVVLQLWLILVLVYCYKKISAEQEAREARNALKTQIKYALAYSL